MRSSGPLRLSGHECFQNRLAITGLRACASGRRVPRRDLINTKPNMALCSGRRWRLAWLRDAGRPGTGGQPALVVRAAAARAALPRRRRAPPRAPRRLRGEAHGRPGPAGRPATSAAGARPGAPVRSRAPVAAVRAVMARRVTARGAPRVPPLPTHHAGRRGRPPPKDPAGPSPGRRRRRGLAGPRAARPPTDHAGPRTARLPATDRAGRRAGRPRATDRAGRPARRHRSVHAGPAGIRPQTGPGKATGLRQRAQDRAVPAPVPPPGGTRGPSAAMDRGAQAKVQPQGPGGAPASSEGRGRSRARARAGTGAGPPVPDAGPGTGLRRVLAVRPAATR